MILSMGRTEGFIECNSKGCLRYGQRRGLVSGLAGGFKGCFIDINDMYTITMAVRGEHGFVNLMK